MISSGRQGGQPSAARLRRGRRSRVTAATARRRSFSGSRQLGGAGSAQASDQSHPAQSGRAARQPDCPGQSMVKTVCANRENLYSCLAPYAERYDTMTIYIHIRYDDYIYIVIVLYRSA